MPLSEREYMRSQERPLARSRDLKLQNGLIGIAVLVAASLIIPRILSLISTSQSFVDPSDAMLEEQMVKIGST